MGSQSQKIGAYNYQEYITINDIFIENDAQVNVDPIFSNDIIVNARTVYHFHSIEIFSYRPDIL